MMESMRNNYLEEVARSCRNNVAPTPLNDQLFTQYFMNRWSQKQMEGGFPSHARSVMVHGQKETQELPTVRVLRCHHQK
jgi:hypothetical protein